LNTAVYIFSKVDFGIISIFSCISLNGLDLRRNLYYLFI